MESLDAFGFVFKTLFGEGGVIDLGHRGNGHPGPCECYVCRSSLFQCERCGCAEGTLPTQCPGFKVSYHAQSLIMKGVIDYRGGQWVPAHHWRIHAAMEKLISAARNYGASLSQSARAFARLASVARRGYLHKAIRQSGLAKDQKAELHRVANEQLDELEREGRLLRTGSSDER